MRERLERLRMVRRIGTLLAAAALVAVVTTAPQAQAQPSPDAPPPQPAQPQPAQPPPGQPPPGYPPPGYPPPGYAVPYGPEEIEDWEPGEPVPPGYVPETRVRKGLVIGGAITLGVKWLIDVVIAGYVVSLAEVFDADSSAIWPLFVPAVGPFITIATVGEGHPAWVGVLVADGVIQSAGAAMLIVGLAAQEDVLVRQSKHFDVKVTPMVSHNFQGLGLTGTF